MTRGFSIICAALVGAAGIVFFTGSALASPRTNAVPGGVRVAGIRVAGMSPTAATSEVGKAFRTPLTVVVNGKKVHLHPALLAKAYIGPAIAHARSAKPGTNVRLVVSVHGAKVRQAVAALARRFDRKPRSATLAFVAGRPRIKPQVAGARLDQSALVLRIVRSLNANTRRPLSVHTKATVPAVTAGSYGAVILINRAANRLTLFHPDNKVWRIFPVATGQAVYPTPTGRFAIVVKQMNPWWYPPTYDSWAAGLSPVPPGPGNPLGTRWMGLSAPGVGIHGTNSPSSIGYSVSHGCIRMQVVDSEWLFDHVRVGTTVFIV